jgi:2-methylcitrate dehydratase
MDDLTKKLSNFAASLQFASLPNVVVHAAKQRLIDTLGCALGGRGALPVTMAREVGEGVVPGRWSGRVIGFPERTTVEIAAFANSIMSRYLDYNDTGPGSHPSDCIGALIAIAETAGADGRRLLTAMVIAYEILLRLAMATKLRQKGWDQGFVTAIGTAAATGYLLQLSADRIAHSIAIAAVSNVPLRASRAGRLSLWKSAATPFAVKNGLMAAVLAANGMTGPDRPFEGRHGLWEQITGPFEIEPFGNEGGNYLLPRWARLKYWPVEYNAQISVWAARDLTARLAIEDISAIEVFTYHQAWHEIGSDEAKWDPQTRETADHSLPYIFARALTDGEIAVSAFDEAAYRDPGIRPLMKKIKISVDDSFTAMFPSSIPVRVEATTVDGRRHVVELSNPRGHETNPMTDDDIEDKFRKLARGVLQDDASQTCLEVWWRIDDARTLTDALDLLCPSNLSAVSGAHSSPQ